MKIQELRSYIHQNIEQFAGRKATMSGELFGGKFQICGMLSSTWQGRIPVCTVRNIEKNQASISIAFKQIRNIEKTTKCFDDPELLELDIDLESRDYYSHTGKDRIVFVIELKTGEKVELWINPTEEYANTQNILDKVQGVKG